MGTPPPSGPTSEASTGESGAPPAPDRPDAVSATTRHVNWDRLGTLGTLLSAFVAVVAAGFVFIQIHVAREQNRAADEVSLTALVSSLSKQVGGPPGQSNQAQLNVEAEEAAEASQGLELVGKLSGAVPPVDDYEIGKGFLKSGDYPDAISMFQRALAPQSWPRYRIDALQGLATIFYQLGTPPTTPMRSATSSVRSSATRTRRTQPPSRRIATSSSTSCWTSRCRRRSTARSPQRNSASQKRS